MALDPANAAAPFKTARREMRVPLRAEDDIATSCMISFHEAIFMQAI
jgi:hypothetical protein